MKCCKIVKFSVVSLKWIICNVRKTIVIKKSQFYLSKNSVELLEYIWTCLRVYNFKEMQCKTSIRLYLDSSTAFVSFLLPREKKVIPLHWKYLKISYSMWYIFWDIMESADFRSNRLEMPHFEFFIKFECWSRQRILLFYVKDNWKILCKMLNCIFLY